MYIFTYGQLYSNYYGYVFLPAYFIRHLLLQIHVNLK